MTSLLPVSSVRVEVTAWVRVRVHCCGRVKVIAFMGATCMKALRLLCAVCCLCSAANDARADVIVGTMGAWNGTTSIGPIGHSSTPGAIATFGQTFQLTGPETILKDFSLFIDDGANPLSFKAYLMQWDGTKAVGPSLFEGAATTTNKGGAGGFEKVTFNTGNLSLVAGQNYVLFQSISEPAFYLAGNGPAQLGAISGNPYSLGSSVSLNDGGNPALWTSVAWNVLSFDAAFEATLSATPEPSSLALLASAALGMWACRRRFAPRHCGQGPGPG